MSGSPSSIDHVAALCQQHAAQISGWVAPFFAEPIELVAEEHTELTSAITSAELSGPGLALPLRGEGAAALLLIPAGGVPLADWTRETPQVAPRSATLVRELRNLLFPDQVAVSAKAFWLDNVAAALEQSGLAAGTRRVPLRVSTSGQATVCSLIWPCPQLDRLAAPAIPSSTLQKPLPGGEISPEVAATSPPTQTADATFDARPAPPADETAAAAGRPPVTPPSADPGSYSSPRLRIEYRDLDEGLRRLPAYARSLLRVRVPVAVTLASTKQSVRRILELGPGAIIQFKKTCEETLTLEVAGRVVAEGEAVKVGDKFGLWITSMILPKERYQQVGGTAQEQPSSGRATPAELTTQAPPA